MTPKAVSIRVAQLKKNAVDHFKGNPYVTIHNYQNASDPAKRNPFNVWIDLNYPVYVLRGQTPVLEPNGLKDVCIQFSTDYPKQKPTVVFPVDIASIHTWNRRVACTHEVYYASTHNLIKEIENTMMLAASCPETINYRSPTPDHKWLIPWTQKGLESGILPTVQYNRLLRILPARRTGFLT